MSVIDVKNVTKYYKKFKALDSINLEIPKGRIIGLLGKNGAGKSTLMRCMLGYLKFSGNIDVLGEDINKQREMIHNEVAFIPDVNSLDDRLTVSQTLEYVSGLNPRWNQEKADALLAASDLPLKVKIAHLSKGMKTKLYLLITLALDVKILLLDEPTLGLDIVFRKEFFNTILGQFFDEEKTIIISTHQVEEVEHILQDIIFLDKGRVILQEDITQLKSKFAVVNFPADEKEKLEALNPILISPTLGAISGIVEADKLEEGIEFTRPTLSDLFLAKVGGSNV